MNWTGTMLSVWTGFPSPQLRGTVYFSYACILNHVCRYLCFQINLTVREMSGQKPRASALSLEMGMEGPLEGWGQWRTWTAGYWSHHPNTTYLDSHRQAGAIKLWLHYPHCWDMSLLSPINLARHMAAPGQKPSSTGLCVLLLLFPPLGLCPLLHPYQQRRGRVGRAVP